MRGRASRRHGASTGRRATALWKFAAGAGIRGRAPEGGKEPCSRSPSSPGSRRRCRWSTSTPTRSSRRAISRRSSGPGSASTCSRRCASPTPARSGRSFVLNREPYRNAEILIAGENFGCGSSREHAPWALLDFGIRCVIAPSFADIFFNNCFKNGILPIVLPQEQVDLLLREASRGEGPDLHGRPREAGDPPAGRQRGAALRGRRVPQALPAERPRRRRADDAEGGADRRFRAGSAAPRPGSIGGGRLRWRSCATTPPRSAACCCCRATASARRSCASAAA